MTKSQLIKAIHKQTNYNYAEIESIIDILFDQITTGLLDDSKVVISGFGTFEKYYQAGYRGVNPATGESIKVPGNYKIRFNSSKKLKSNFK
jgi:DNA-binding protein HU-beta